MRRRRVRNRQDHNNFPGHNRSAGITRAARILISDGNRDLRKWITARFKKFLKKKAKISSQMFLVFAYLFFLKHRISRVMFSSFKAEMLRYYHKRMDEKADED